MSIHNALRSLLTCFVVTAAVAGAAACAAPTDAPVGTTASSLTIAPLGARERSVMRAKAGSAFHLDKGGKLTKNGRTYAAAPNGSGTWAFAELDEQGNTTAFQLVDTKAAATSGGVSTASVHVLDDMTGGGSSSCDYGACQSATSAAISAYGDWLSTVGDDFVGLAYGLKWYQAEVDKKNACGGC